MEDFLSSKNYTETRKNGLKKRAKKGDRLLF